MKEAYIDYQLLTISDLSSAPHIYYFWPDDKEKNSSQRNISELHEKQRDNKNAKTRHYTALQYTYAN